MCQIYLLNLHTYNSYYTTLSVRTVQFRLVHTQRNDFIMSSRDRLVPFDQPFFRRQHSWNLDGPWSDLVSPSRLLDQYFGMAFRDDDLLPTRSPTRSRARDLMAALDDEFYRGMSMRPRRLESVQSSGMSEVSLPAVIFILKNVYN